MTDIRDRLPVLEDYLQMLLQMVDLAPDVFFQASAFPIAFRASMAALTLVHSDTIFASLDLFRTILTHDSLIPVQSPPPPKFPAYASAIRAVVDREGFEFIGYLLSGLVGDFPEDSTSVVVSSFRALSALWSSQMLSWLPAVVEQLPTTTAPKQAQTQFLTEVTRYAILVDNSCPLNQFSSRNTAQSTVDNTTKSNTPSSHYTESPVKLGIEEEWARWIAEQ
jgi:transportin-3